ncbi:hypothetical protein JZX87_03555 [Agrobacterium sp. Ap1]|jgi:hypothetical protein|uniref:hypothetical protein n=1 Tax=Agrobacterium sp. Ap1 TaxID=2815337 RepID=UPI0011D122D2|nr:hypothetical protein [Agrobacterium sp. Ap1]MBO0140240.1 hypothetical protein [Agrobacterium sp. Ap1]
MPAAYEPIEPEELERLQTIFETARYIACMSRHDPAAERLAAMTIRFYQLGIRDDDALIHTIVKTNRALRPSRREQVADLA